MQSDSPDRHVTSQTEIFGLEDLICAWVVEDGFGMNTGLVCESTVATKSRHRSKYSN